MVDQRKEAAELIHGYALVGSAAAAIFAQTAPINVGVTTVWMGLMFNSLVKTMRPDVEDADAVFSSIGGAFIGTAFTTLAVRSAVGLVPVFGNLANAAMTFALFETTGWGMYALLKDGRDLKSITKEEFQKFIAIGKEEKLDVNAAIEKMPKTARVQYEALVKALKDRSLSDADREAIRAEISRLLDPYLEEQVVKSKVE